MIYQWGTLRGEIHVDADSTGFTCEDDVMTATFEDMGDDAILATLADKPVPPFTYREFAEERPYVVPSRELTRYLDRHFKNLI